MARKNTLFNAAIRCISDEIAAIESREANQLPPVRFLAQKAGVSLGTLQKALRALESSGKIVCTAGSGIFLPSQSGAFRQPRSLSAEEKSTRARRYGWQHAYMGIMEMLSDGTYPPGTELPSRKVLRAELTVSFATLRKALDLLCRKKIIEPYQKNFRVAASRSQRHRNSIVIIVGGFSPTGSLGHHSRLVNQLTAFEEECARRGVKLVLAVNCLKPESRHYYVNGKPIILDKRYVEKHGVIGCIVWLVFDNPASVKKNLDRLVSLQLPAAVFNDMDVPGQEVFLPRFPVITAAASATCGFMVGRFLSRMGHRTIAYVAPEHPSDDPALSDWSIRRLNGLLQAARESPCEMRVIEVTGQERGFDLRFEKQFEETLLPYVNNHFRRRNDFLSQLFARTVSSRSFAIEREMILENAHLVSLPFFEKALASKNVTAWVCQNDMTAVPALKFLREKGVAVPEQISVIGFDDTFEAQEQRITSYNFNASLVAQRLLSTLLKGPRHLIIPFNKEPFEIEGRIVERDTTAPPRKPFR